MTQIIDLIRFIDFLCTSLGQNLRRQRNTSFTSKMIWQKKLPFKISFFMLRLLQNIIPTDEVVQKFRIILPSKCSCYNIQKQETIIHLFCNSYIAKQVCSFFGHSCGIKTMIMGHLTSSHILKSKIIKRHAKVNKTNLEDNKLYNKIKVYYKRIL